MYIYRKMQYYFNFKPKQTFMFYYKERAVISVFLLAILSPGCITGKRE